MNVAWMRLLKRVISVLLKPGVSRAFMDAANFLSASSTLGNSSGKVNLVDNNRSDFGWLSSSCNALYDIEPTASSSCSLRFFRVNNNFYLEEERVFSLKKQVLFLSDKELNHIPISQSTKKRRSTRFSTVFFSTLKPNPSKTCEKNTNSRNTHAVVLSLLPHSGSSSSPLLIFNLDDYFSCLISWKKR